MSKALDASKFLNDPNAVEVAYTPSGTGAVATNVQRKLRERVSLLDFGADPTGAFDATTALINAISAAKATGVNAVDCSGGKWLISTGGITLNNVSLYAETPPDFAATYGDTGGTFLLTSTTTSPFELQQGWAIRGLTFHYPNQDGISASPVVYPALFVGTYVAAGVMEDVTVTNAYQIFKFNSGIAIGDLRFDRCRMYGIDRVFWFLQGAPESINISDCFFSHGIFVPSYTPNVYLRDYTSASGEFCRIDVGSSSWTSVDGFNLSNSLVYGYRYGIRVLSGMLNVSTINNNWFDAVRTALSVENPGLLANTRWTDNYHYSFRPGFISGTPETYGYNTTDPVLSFSSVGGGGSLLVSGNDFVHSMGHHIFWNALSFNDVKITDNRFKNWGRDAVSAATTYYAISATDSALNGTIGLNKFQPGGGVVAHNRNGIGIGNASDVAIVTNEFDDCFLPVWIVAATRARVIGNTSMATGFTNSLKNDAAAGVVQASGNLWDKAATGRSGLPAFSANAGAQTFTGAKTQATFTNMEHFDSDGNFASSTFTAPTTDEYEFDVQLANATGVTAGDVWALSIEQAGSGSVVFTSSVYVPANAVAAAPLKCSARFRLTAGDTVMVYVTRVAGVGNYVTINNGNYNTFTGKRLS